MRLPAITEGAGFGIEIKARDTGAQILYAGDDREQIVHLGELVFRADGGAIISFARDPAASNQWRIVYASPTGRIIRATHSRSLTGSPPDRKGAQH